MKKKYSKNRDQTPSNKDEKSSDHKKILYKPEMKEYKMPYSIRRLLKIAKLD